MQTNTKNRLKIKLKHISSITKENKNVVKANRLCCNIGKDLFKILYMLNIVNSF